MPWPSWLGATRTPACNLDHLTCALRVPVSLVLHLASCRRLESKMSETKKARHYVRLRQLIGNPRAVPPYTGLLPISAATVWRMVATGEFPQPMKLGPRTTVWSMEDIEAWLKACKGSKQ